ncbi:MAG: exopolysaccharide biosynthesis protein [Verrucomicrobiota bacterium]
MNPAEESTRPNAGSGGLAAPGPVSLSEQLSRIVSTPGDRPLDLTQLLAQTADRGPYALIILLCLPFMAPFSLPGVSNVFGVVIALLAWRIFQGRTPRLPRRLGERRIDGKVLAGVVRASIRVVHWIEKATRPRAKTWIRGDTARRVNALILIYGGIVLAAPIPPIIPLSNLTPSIGIVLVAAGMMEEDGVVLWMGYLATVAASAYIGFLIYIQSALILHLWRQYSEPLLRRLGGLLA